MEFGSTHVYNYENSDEEVVSDEEFEQGITVSDDEDTSSAFVKASGERSLEPQAARHVVCDGLLSNELPTLGKPSFNQAVYDNIETKPQQRERGGLFARKDKKKKKAAKVKFESAEPKKVSHWRSEPNYAYRAAAVAENETYRRWRRADTNVVSVKFGALKRPSEMHTGDPVVCKQCSGILSHVSKLTTPEGQHTQIWKCEYCGKENNVDLMPQEMPCKNDITYMIEPARATRAAGPSGTDESLVVFCIDTSGSMCVTTEVPENIKMKFPDRLKKLQSLNTTHESQLFPGQRRNVVYISRLQCVQAAIDHQLGEMEKEHPHRRVALVAFNNEVNIIGDGTGLPVTVTGDKLTDKDKLIEEVSQTTQPGFIKDSRQTLAEKLYQLEEDGATALGPALILSTAMASANPGSKVILCTDGLANVGLGNLDDPENVEEAERFYSEVATAASNKGVSVSVISIASQDCKLVELGKVTDITGGQVNIVDPLKLTSEFGSILADPIIATNVTATFIIHKGLYIRHEETQTNKVSNVVGNVTAETQITFEYGVRKHDKSKQSKGKGKKDTADIVTEESKAAEQQEQMEVEEGATGTGSAGDGAGCSHHVPTSHSEMRSEPSSYDLDQLTELPFQLHLTYTDMEGAKALRVITQVKPVTKDRNVAEKDMNMDVLGVHTTQTAAKYALKGHYSKSRLMSMANQRLVSRYTKSDGSTESRERYGRFVNAFAPLETTVRSAQLSERSTRGTTYSDDEDEYMTLGAIGPEADQVQTLSDEAAPKKLKSASEASAPTMLERARRAMFSDSMSNVIYQAKKFVTPNTEKHKSDSSDSDKE